MSQFSFDKVAIDGFRALRRLQLDDLGLVNILVGANNSGKTSVLEAMSILCDRFNPYEWLSMVVRRDFGRLDENRIQSLRWCFPQHGELADREALFEGKCEMSCLGSFRLRKLVAHYKELVGQPDPAEMERLVRISGRARHWMRNDYEELRPGAEITHIVKADIHPNDRTTWSLFTACC